LKFPSAIRIAIYSVNAAHFFLSFASNLFAFIKLCTFILLALMALSEAHAEPESRTEREKIATSRNRRFFGGDRAKKFLGINGHYSSDYNSRSYEISSRFLYQSFKYIHELNFNYNLDFADSGSGKNKKYDVKKSSEYDTIFASKMRINKTKYYGVYFHRTIYDNLSSYYYDTRNAVGLGRFFLDEKLEFDLSGGYHQTKNYGHQFETVASLRFNKRLSDKINLVQRGFFFINHGSADSEIMTSLVYRLQNNLSFEVRHDYGKRRYYGEGEVVNNVSRALNFGLVFDLD
jgi:hypothetical protein